ncbi:hypothetical protein AX14_002620 [Amanita brunnescens Koide BX004]|nr:hypothetical protein AX14_002620 [Amanita brunnescens Koide BX004]
MASPMEITYQGLTSDDATIGRFDPSNSPAQLIDVFVAMLKPMCQLLIVTCVGSAMLVPLFVLLWFSSNSETRRKPIFIANVVSIVIGLAFAGVSIAQILSQLLNPLATPNIPLYLTYNILFGFTPLLVESILLIRLFAVYPFRTTPLKTFLAIFIPITLLKVGRLANTITYVENISDEILGARQQSLFWYLDTCRIWFTNYTVEWFLQVVDNTSMSVLFLVKLNEVRALRTRAQRWSSTLEALFWIAVSNFVIPVMLSIAQLVVMWISKDMITVALICIVNIYGEIIGVLLATIWTGESRDQPRINGGMQSDRGEIPDNRDMILKTCIFNWTL